MSIGKEEGGQITISAEFLQPTDAVHADEVSLQHPAQQYQRRPFFFCAQHLRHS